METQRGAELSVVWRKAGQFLFPKQLWLLGWDSWAGQHNVWAAGSNCQVINYRIGAAVIIIGHTDRKISAKVELSMNICRWGRVKVLCHWNANDMWLSIHPYQQIFIERSIFADFFWQCAVRIYLELGWGEMSGSSMQRA